MTRTKLFFKIKRTATKYGFLVVGFLCSVLLVRVSCCRFLCSVLLVRVSCCRFSVISGVSFYNIHECGVCNVMTNTFLDKRLLWQCLCILTLQISRGDVCLQPRYQKGVLQISQKFSFSVTQNWIWEVCLFKEVW